MTSTTYRDAVKVDLSAIIDLLADDPLGQTREIVADPIDPAYQTAFSAIDADPNQQLIVVEIDAKIIGCMQISYIPGLSRKGMWRGQIESVRIASDRRGNGLGREMFLWAIDACKKRGCKLVQLTSDKTRPDALRFYEGLGFEASHEGFKISL